MDPELECRMDASRARAHDLVENHSCLPSIAEPDLRRRKMEELMRVLSELPAEDAAVALATLRRVAAGSPTETSLRSLCSDSALYDVPPPSQHVRRMWTASNGDASRLTNGCRSRRGARAVHSPPFATVSTPPPKSLFHDADRRDAEAGGHLRASERCSERPGASIGPATRMLPRFVELEAGSLYSIPSEPGKRPAPDSSCMALCTEAPASVASCMTSRTEALVRALSPKEKDRLLRHFLSSRKPSGRGRRGGARAGASNRGNGVRLEESEVLDVQAGLWRSIKDKAENTVRDDLDKEAVKLGIRASRREHQNLRRQLCEGNALEDECVRLVVAASEREFREMRRRKEEDLDNEAARLGLRASQREHRQQDRAASAVREDLDNEAVELGLRASRREHLKPRCAPRDKEAFEEDCVRLAIAASERKLRELRRRNKEEEIECNALTEKAKLASLLSSKSCPPFLLRRENGNSTPSPEDRTRASH